MPFLLHTSIYEACRYYELFQNTELKGKCAVVTSYNPSIRDIVTEDVGANTETEKESIYQTYIKLLKGRKTEDYEDDAKARFIKEPANLRLLIVVDKLLTGLMHLLVRIFTLIKKCKTMVCFRLFAV